MAKTLRQWATQRTSELNHWARQYGAPATLTPDELMGHVKQAHGNCAACKRHVGWWCLQIDHLVALANGGGSNTDNLRLICKACNRRKGDAPREIAESPDYYTELEVRRLFDWKPHQIRAAIQQGELSAIKYSMNTFITKASANSLLQIKQKEKSES